MKRLLSPAFCVVLGLTLLGACETTSSAPPVGASQVALERDRYRVVFRGVSGASAEEVQDRALLHAANLTLNQGYDWFQVVSRSVDLAAPTRPRINVGIGGGSFGWNGGFGVGASRSFGGEPTYVASLEIVFGRGQRPFGASLYDARDLAASLGPRLAPPPPR